MGKIRARPNVHREEALPEMGNEADIARMFEKLKMRSPKAEAAALNPAQVGVRIPPHLPNRGRSLEDRHPNSTRTYVGSNPTGSAIPTFGSAVDQTGLSRESPGSSSTEATATADGELTRPHGPFPALAIGPDSEQSAVSMASNDKALTAAPCSTGQPRRILWDKPSPRTPDTRYSADLAYAVLREGAYPNYSYMPLKRGQEGTYAPLPGGLKPSFKGAAVRCEQDLHAT